MPGSGPSPSQLTNVNGVLFFAADDRLRGLELWAATASGSSPAGLAPLLEPIPDQAVPAGQDVLAIALTAADPDGVSLTFTAAAQSPAYVLDQELSLEFAGDYSEEWLGLGARWLLGAGEQWYYLLPSGELYRWGEEGATLVGLAGASYYADPSLLYDAPPDQPRATLSIVDGVLVIDREDGFTGSLVVTVRVSDGSWEDVCTFLVLVTL
jgi:hypothetical protein